MSATGEKLHLFYHVDTIPSIFSLSRPLYPYFFPFLPHTCVPKYTRQQMLSKVTKTHNGRKIMYIHVDLKGNLCRQIKDMLGVKLFKITGEEGKRCGKGLKSSLKFTIFLPVIQMHILQLYDKVFISSNKNNSME